MASFLSYHEKKKKGSATIDGTTALTNINAHYVYGKTFRNILKLKHVINKRLGKR